jgi:hypothetical protein
MELELGSRTYPPMNRHTKLPVKRCQFGLTVGQGRTGTDVMTENILPL